MATIVIDGSNNQLSIGGGTWSEASESRFFGGTAIWPAFASNSYGDTGDYGTLSMVFQGMCLLLSGFCVAHLNCPYRNFDSFFRQYSKPSSFAMGVRLYRWWKPVQYFLSGSRASDIYPVVSVSDAL